MPTQKIDPKVIFASGAPAIDKPPVFSDKTKGWDVARANDGRPQIKEMNKMQQDTDLKILWLNENAVLPYDETIDYPDGAVTVKDGSFKQLSSGSWVEFLDDFADKDAVKRGIANRYDSSLTYNSGERVVLANGDIVKSTVDGNTNNPNVDMTGWKFNDNTVESIADLVAIQNQKDGQVVYVKGYYKAKNLALANPYKGGGVFVFDGSKSNINDGGLIINGWCRQFTGNIIETDWFGLDATGLTDCSQKLQAMINLSSPESNIEIWNASYNFTSPKYEIKVNSGRYLLQSMVLLPPYFKLKGSGNAYYFSNRDADREFTTFVTDFNDQASTVFGNRVFLKSTGAIFDHKKFVNYRELEGITHSIELSGFSIVPKTASKRVMLGVSLFAAPTSIIKDIYITGVDTAVVCHNCYVSDIDIMTEHNLCGVNLAGDNNAVRLNGYFQAESLKTPVSGNSYTYMRNFDNSTYLPASVFANKDLQYGVYLDSNQGVISDRIVSEVNDISVMLIRGDIQIGVLYSEINRVASLSGFISNFVIGDITGISDNSSFLLGLSCTGELLCDNQDRVVSDRVITADDKYSGYVTVPSNFGFFNHSCFERKQRNEFYIDNVNGKSTNSGSSSSPLDSLNSLNANYLLRKKAPKIKQASVILKNSTTSYTSDNAPYSNCNLTFIGESREGVSFTVPSYLNLIDSKVTFKTMTVRAVNNYTVFLSQNQSNSEICINSCNVNIADGTSLVRSEYSWKSRVQMTVINSNVAGGSASNLIKSDANSIIYSKVELLGCVFSGGIVNNGINQPVNQQISFTSL